MDRLRAEVVYATAEGADVVEVSLQAGATLRDAVAASAIADRHFEIDLAALRVGVFGRERPAGTAVAQGDRIEIYRPLAADPKEMRRARAATSRRTTR